MSDETLKIKNSRKNSVTHTPGVFFKIKPYLTVAVFVMSDTGSRAGSNELSCHGGGEADTSGGRTKDVMWYHRLVFLSVCLCLEFV